MTRYSPTGRILRDPPLQNIPMPKDVAARMVARLRLESFLKDFPDNATCWSEATAELPDMYVWLSKLLGLEPVGRDNCPTPADWNTKYKAAIRRGFDHLSGEQVKEFADRDRTIAERDATIKELRATLEPFAREAETWSDDPRLDHLRPVHLQHVTVGDLRRARDLVRTK